MFLGEGHENQEIGLRTIHEFGQLAKFWTQIVGNFAPLLTGGLGIALIAVDHRPSSL